jgi:hypothetical protein
MGPEVQYMSRYANYVSSIWGRDSSVGVVTNYGLDGPGIKSRWGRYFPHLSRPALGFTQPPIQRVQGVSGGKADEAWC